MKWNEENEKRVLGYFEHMTQSNRTFRSCMFYKFVGHNNSCIRFMV